VAPHPEETVEWFYADSNGNQQGPFSRHQMLALVQGGTVHSATLIWKEGMPNWVPAAATELCAPSARIQGGHPSLLDNAPPLAAQPVPMHAQEFNKAMLSKVIAGIITILTIAFLRYLVGILPGMDFVLGRAVLGFWLKMALSLALLVIMLRLFTPIKIVAQYYIGLICRVTTSRSDPHLFAQVSSAGTYVVLIVYLGVFYQAVLPALMGLGNIFLGPDPQLYTIVKLIFALVGIILVIKLITILKPLMARVTTAITDSTAAFTEEMDSKLCAGCGARVPRTAKFCPSCGRTT
jgi:ribosomal protein L40E